MARRAWLVILLAGSIGLAGCASRSTVLVHPESGANVKCSASGAGIMAGAADSFVEECLRSYERQGYVRVEKLSPEQRADLERRGVLPKIEEAQPPMGY